MIDPSKVKSPEQHSYESYVEFCKRISVTPMQFDDWRPKFGKLNPKQSILGLRILGQALHITS